MQQEVVMDGQAQACQEGGNTHADGHCAPPTVPSACGGKGDILSNHTGRRDRDVRILARAIREKWPIPEEKRASVVARLLRVVENGEDRDATSAARALVSMEAQNMQANGEVQQSSPITINIRQAILEATKALGHASPVVDAQPLLPPSTVEGEGGGSDSAG